MGTSEPSRDATPAISALLRAEVTHQVHRFGHDPRTSAYGREAARALEVVAERVFKTLVCSLGTRLAAIGRPR